ncbi:MAG: hypothetical protein GX597_22470, partial [Anaerolineaceae bacterium]|nr:hypothetical protein [Anaerolineaceae bacterium]
MTVLTVPRTYLSGMMRHSVRQPGEMLWVPTGQHASAERMEWLAREAIPLPAQRDQPGLLAWGAASPDAWSARAIPEHADGWICLGMDGLAGRIWGAVRVGSQQVPLQEVRLVGSGMYRIGGPTLDRPAFGSVPPHPEQAAFWFERWSRTMGALGRQAWRRLTRLQVAIVGLGRTGSAVAVTLARLGVRRVLLVDPDTVERHNLGEMDGVDEQD